MRNYKLFTAIIVLSLNGIANAQFTTIFNVPPDVAPDSIGSDTQLNLMDGGVLTGVPTDPDDPDSQGIFAAGSPDAISQNVELNISGGVAGFLDIYAGATLNMSDGTVADLIAYDGATVNITGGTISELGGIAEAGSSVNISGGIFPWPFMFADQTNVTLSGGAFGEVRYSGFSSGNLTLIGNDFLVNGSPPAESTLRTSGTVTGVFNDGSPFIVQHSGGIEFQTVPIPPIDPTSIVINSEVAPYGIRSGQTITVMDGGKLPAPFTAVGGTVNLLGGESDSVFAADSDLNLADGSVRHAQLSQGSKLTISGGSLDRVSARSESTVEILGGSVHRVEAIAGSRIVMKSGHVGDVRLSSGTSMLLSGGSAARDSGETFDVQLGSELEVFGTEFLLNHRASVPGLNEPGDTVLFTLRGGSMLTGRLIDGSDFSLQLNEDFSFGRDRVHPDASLRLTLVPEPTAAAMLIATFALCPLQLRSVLC